MSPNSDELTLMINLNIKSVLPDSVAVVACIGIEFFQEVCGKMEVMEVKCCMKIVDVF